MARVLSVVIALLLLGSAFAQNPATTVNVDVQSNRHPISPLIYGVNLFESSDTATILEDLNAPINRYGGNRASTYNWQLNSDNRGNDFFFESITDDAGTIPARRTDDFIADTKAASAEPMVTVPMLSWVAQSGTHQPLPCSYPRSSFPTQNDFGDPFDPDCGNGLAPDRSPINGADPTLALVPNSLNNQQSWVQHTTAAFNTAANGGLKYYILDNEHDLWPDTHHDAVANAPHYDADTSSMLIYAGMIKTQDPGAFIVGPEASGWLGYIYSPFDNQDGRAHNFANDHVDHDAVGDYLPWFLGQFKAYSDSHNGLRLLDYFTVHYYPQGGDNNSNTRSLWDPNFVDPSFIGEKIMLIPRMKQWVAANYPGTKIGITEYNWGDIDDEADNDSIAFAVTQADVLGIFGREGLDLATRFNAPIPNLPSYNAMKMYRNYDGQKSTFGEVGVSATSAADPDNIVAFAAQRASDSKVTVMLLSKYAAGTTQVTLHIANFTAAATAQRWQLVAPGTSIQSLAGVAVQDGSVSLTLPAQSITLLVLPQQNQQPPPPAPIASFSTNNLSFGTQLLNSFTVNSTLSLTNTGNAPLNISGLALSGVGLLQISNCGNLLSPGQACFISLKPTVVGALSGTIMLTDDAADSPQSVAITGTGRDILLSTPRDSRSKRLTPQGSAARRRIQ